MDKIRSLPQGSQGAGSRGHLYLGHPDFEGFTVVEGASVDKFFVSLRGK